jgi:hypothetical protein
MTDDSFADVISQRSLTQKRDGFSKKNVLQRIREKKKSELFIQKDLFYSMISPVTACTSHEET